MPKEKENKTGRAVLMAQSALPKAPDHMCMNVESVFEQDIEKISVFKADVYISGSHHLSRHVDGQWVASILL